jgi:replicative DNA helicase
MQQIIAKNRDGATGSTPYLYVKPLSRFYAAQLKTVKVRTEDK